ncbi:hypothetical protein [Kribbella soli]|uniref:hypothetical protein n=1 Tax=Kribbella soli TaxID=1124743 RepID=UPI001EDF6C11|nr:hypothetical protein [Kribbella soli]
MPRARPERPARLRGPRRRLGLGSPALQLPAGETLTLAEIEGPGVIRHIWLTVADRTDQGPAPG